MDAWTIELFPWNKRLQFRFRFVLKTPTALPKHNRMHFSYFKHSGAVSFASALTFSVVLQLSSRRRWICLRFGVGLFSCLRVGVEWIFERKCFNKFAFCPKSSTFAERRLGAGYSACEVWNWFAGYYYNNCCLFNVMKNMHPKYAPIWNENPSYTQRCWIVLNETSIFQFDWSR